MKRIIFSIGLMSVVALPLLATAQDQTEGRKLYASYCASCHGEKGKGDGVAASSLPVKPKDHTNGAVMNSMTDQALVDVISKGGGGTGKSPFMPAWGTSLNEKQVRDIVIYIRTLAVPPYKP